MLRQLQEIRLLFQAFKLSLEAMPVLLYMYFLIALCFMSVLFLVEPRDNVPVFSHAAWLTVVSMTTLGYGDVVPKTTPGYIAIAMVVIITALYFAIPVGIIGTAFGKVWNERYRILL